MTSKLDSQNTKVARVEDSPMCARITGTETKIEHIQNTVSEGSSNHELTPREMTQERADGLGIEFVFSPRCSSMLNAIEPCGKVKVRTQGTNRPLTTRGASTG